MKKPTKREQKDKEEGLTYPPVEDIYNQAQEEHEIDADDISKMKAPNLKPDRKNEKDFEEAVSGSDLDIPGSETNEGHENGLEDEENDFYSLGGDKA
ncbi:MAG TPA: hypothetical protein VK154_06275 [Chitinophagales bacterium]|nr:hypothetical protein [Chitinophagales bacterium]